MVSICPKPDQKSKFLNSEFEDQMACQIQYLLPRYNSSEAYSSIRAALKAGFSMIDTALDYHNQDLQRKRLK